MFPSTHTFQILIEDGDPLTNGGGLRPKNDFTGYLSLNGSKKGIIGLNSENITGSVCQVNCRIF